MIKWEVLPNESVAWYWQLGQITFDFNQILISYVFSLIYKIILLPRKLKFIYY